MNNITMISAARLVESHKAELSNPIYNVCPKIKSYNERIINELTEKLNAFNQNWLNEYNDFKKSCLA